MTSPFWPHQEVGLEFLVDRRRAALFDEPGLGKSMQALLAMNDLTHSGRMLIVCTGDALGTWQDESERWLQTTPSMYAGLKPDPAVLEDGLVVTNYHRLSTALEYGGWDGIIFDEAQALRNRNTRTLFKAVRSIVGKARSGYLRTPMFFLSGSPVVKHAGDVWPLLWLIDKRRWSSYWKWVQKYTITWEDEYDGHWHTEGITNLRAMWEELSEVVLRRKQKEVQPDLPPVIRQRIPLDMTPRQAKAYREIERDMMAEIDLPTRHSDSDLILTPTVLARETRLRQLLVMPRLIGIDDDGAALSAVRDKALNSSRPFVVFTSFPEAFPHFEAFMAKTGRPLYFVRGGTGLKFRQPVDLFKAAAHVGESPILFASVEMAKSWSVSRETYECYNLGPSWNNTTQMQAEARLGREGQESTVYSGYFAHRGTHDMDQLEIISGKRRLADAILDRVRLKTL